MPHIHAPQAAGPRPRPAADPRRPSRADAAQRSPAETVGPVVILAASRRERRRIVRRLRMAGLVAAPPEAAPCPRGALVVRCTPALLSRALLAAVDRSGGRIVGVLARRGDRRWARELPLFETVRIGAPAPELAARLRGYPA